VHLPPPTVVILAAVEAELRPLERLISEARPPFAPRFVVTGVGKASAAMETALALGESSAAIALQLGSAGAFRGAGLSPGDVVIADGEVLGDDGVETPDGFIDLSGLGLAAATGPLGRIGNQVPTCMPGPGTLEALVECAMGRFAVRTGRLVTVSTGSGSERRAAEIASRWSPLAESMEGAAAALAAWRLGAAFFEVRGISNLTGKRDRAAWDIETACGHAAEIALRLLELEVGAARRKQGSSDG
jgi:futalosine hydrolase